MNEFKPGDRVTFTDELIKELSFPHAGKVQAWPTQRNTISTEKTEDLQHAQAGQPETSATAPMDYGAEKAELQRVLTKRNVTIGRLRAVNRELRRELRVAKSPTETVKPLPTVPPRVGGVYRTRQGEVIKITGNYDWMRHQFFGRTETDGRALSFTSDGYYRDHGEPDSCDLVAEISPPPDPAFSGPLEVGNWYEDDDEGGSGAWLCEFVFIDDQEEFAICSYRPGIVGRRRSYTFRSNGEGLHVDLKLIRKVDPPGGES